MRDHDVPDVGRALPELVEDSEDALAVRVVERVDERQLVPVVAEERVDAAALLLADAPEAGRELDDVLRIHATWFQGAKALSTPRSAGSSSG